MHMHWGFIVVVIGVVIGRVIDVESQSDSSLRASRLLLGEGLVDSNDTRVLRSFCLGEKLVNF